MGNIVYLGDCRQVMKEFPEGSVDLIITSPPYNINLKGAAWDDNMTWADYTGFTAEWMSECYRVLSAGRYLCINVGFMTYAKRNLVFGHTKIARDIGFQDQQLIVWEKTVHRGSRNIKGRYGNPSSIRYANVAEAILLFTKGKQRMIQADVTLEEYEKYSLNLWRISPNLDRNMRYAGHPCAFPPEIPRRLVKLYSNIGETILDPFLGRGTTMRVANDLKRDALGIELAKIYLPLIQEMVGNYKVKECT